MSLLVANGFALDAQEGQALWMLGGLFTVKATTEQTSGGFSLIEFTQPRGTEPPPHTHADEDEAFYVLDGSMSIMCGNESFELGRGGFAFLPRGILHGFTITSDEPLRGLVLTSPAGFDRFVREMGEPAATRTIPQAAPPDIERLVALTQKYGIALQLPGA